MNCCGVCHINNDLRGGIRRVSRSSECYSWCCCINPEPLLTKGFIPHTGVEEDLEKFLETMRILLLDGKLGCLLIQLPPKYEYDLDHLESFLKILPSDFRFAVEFRNLSWMRDETWSLLKKYKVAYTIVDEPLLPPEIHITSDIAYFRWHGHGKRPWFNYRYSKEELEPWIPKVKETSKKVKKIYAYFNNHFHGYAPENCLQVLEMLEMLETNQQEAVEKVKRHRKRPKQATLGAFDNFKTSGI